MVFWETVGDNDFRSLFASVDEEVREEEERKQTERFLRVLDDLDSRIGKSADESSERSTPKGARREHLKVSITDPEKAERENKRERELASRETRKFHNKVHTLDDLPPDELDFASLLGLPPPPEPSEINLEAGRRLSDGKVKYSANIPRMDFATLGLPVDIGGFSISAEYALIGLLVLFLIGLWIGRYASRIKHQRELRKVQQAHAAQLSYFQHQLNSMKTYMSHVSAQPVYMPVPMMVNQPQQGEAQAATAAGQAQQA